MQDLTESTLDLILKSLKDESKNNFLLCGDVNQVIHPSFFSVSRLKSFLRKDSGHELRVCILEKNYRNSKQVIELANRILHLKNHCFASEDKMTVDEEEAFFMKSDTENTGNVGFIAKDKEQEIAEKVPESVNWAVLVLDDESKEDACKLFKTPLVFNIYEAKGLEFENVILYKFMSHEAYNKIWNVACPDRDIENTVKKVRDSYNEKNVNPSRPKDKEDKSFEEHKFYMNALYVGITRAIDNVYIIDDEKEYNLLKVVAPEEKVNVDIKKIEQARKIAEKLQLEEKTEYAQEIMNALKAKECHVEVQDSGKDKQAISKLKTENPTPQKSSMGDKASRTLTKTNQKHDGEKHKAKQNQNESQEDGIKRLIRTSRHNEAVDKLKMAGVSQCDTQQVLIDIICNDKIDELKKIDISQYDKKHILEFSLQKPALKITEFLIKDRGFTPENSNFSVSWLGGDDFELLLQACQYGFFSVAKFLLHYQPDHNKDNILYWAVKEYRNGVDKLLNNRNAKLDSTPLHEAAQKGEKGLTLLHQRVVQCILKNGANVNAKNHNGYAALLLALNGGYSRVVEDLLDDPNINVGCVKATSINKKNKEGQEKFLQKLQQDHSLFQEVQAAEKEEDGGKLDKLLGKIEGLLESKNKHGFKPSLNYSPDGNDENTTIKIAIKAGGKILQLLYDYAKENIGVDSKIFKRLKHAKEQQENSQPKGDVSNVFVSGNLTQDFKLGGV